MATPATIHSLIRQTSRWSTASLQDQSPLIRLLHANYGVAYANALRQVASDQEIQAVAGVNARWLEEIATQAQDAATLNAVRTAPMLAPEGPLVALAKEAVTAGEKARYGAEPPPVHRKLAEGFVLGLGLALAKAVFVVGGIILAGTAIGEWTRKNTQKGLN